MALKHYKPTTPGTRGLTQVDRSDLHRGAPEKAAKMSESNGVAFEVAANATKEDVARAVQQKKMLHAQFRPSMVLNRLR